MLIESFEHAEADFEARLLIDARNELETVIHATDKALRRPDFEVLVNEALERGERERIENAVAEARQAMASTDRALIQQKTGSLNHATRHLAEVVMNRTVREALAGKNVKDV
jgi:molecular chaperone DnaK (HSP70)